MKNTLFVFLFFYCLTIQAQTFTQEVNASGGGYYNQINGSMQFTIGEPLTETYTNSSAKLYQGFQQGSYTIVSVTELPLLTDLDVNLYPNPSSGIFNLLIQSDLKSSFKMEVIDAQGKTIISKEVYESIPETINLSDFSGGMYYVKIINTEKKYLKTYNIVKQ